MTRTGADPAKVSWDSGEKPLESAIQRPDANPVERKLSSRDPLTFVTDRLMGMGAAGLDSVSSVAKLANERTPLDNIPGGAAAFKLAEMGGGVGKLMSPILPDAVNRYVDARRGDLAAMRAAAWRQAVLPARSAG